MKKKLLVFLSLLLLVATIFARPVNALDIEYNEENIRDYDVEIYLNEDATMEVTEKIQVYAAGEEIKHGIYRDFPTQYSNKKVKFDVTEVLLDGDSENYSLEAIDRGVRIKIGNENENVSKGLHTYTISYETERQIAFEDDYDELYWNVIGSGWNFSIDHCHARVYLPEGAKVIEDKLKTYTGEYGSKEKTNHVYMYTAGNFIDYEIMDRLNKQEAFTISVCIEKGALIEPSMSQKIGWFLEDNAIALTLIILMLFLAIWQIVMWKKRGVDPKPNVIIPKYFPPEGMAPSDTKYVSTMGSMSKIMEATIINMAVKGYFKFEKADKKKIKIVKNLEKTDLSQLDENELKIYNSFNTEETLVYSSSLQSKIQKCTETISKNLKEKYNDKLFFKNTSLITISIVATIIFLVISTIVGVTINPFATYGFMEQFIVSIPLGFFTMFLISLVNTIKRGSSPALVVILLVIFTIPIIMAIGIFALSMIISLLEFSLNVWAIIIVFVDNYVFYKLIRRYSEEGLRKKEDIEGFKMFIKTAKDDDFKEKTPEMFDKYFPYAYVLGLENKWAKKFEDVLAEANYTPTWCSYDMFNAGTFNAMVFTNAFSSSFSSGMSSASTAPSSSGGSGGGGFSGGGGGGRRPEGAGKALNKNESSLFS